MITRIQPHLKARSSLVTSIFRRLPILQTLKSHQNSQHSNGVQFDTLYSEAEIDTIKKYFDKVDQEHSNTIDVFQFNDFIQLTIGRYLDTTDLRHLFAEVDMDKDNEITVRDIIKHLEKQFHHPPSSSKIKQVFCLYDKDEDGKIKLHELREVLFHLGYFVSHNKEIETIFDKKDTQKHRRITYKEFIEIMNNDIPKLIR